MKSTITISTWLWILVLLPTLPLLGVIGYSAYQFAQESERHLEASLVNQTDELARHAQVRIEQVASALTALAQSHSVQVDDMARFYAFAQRVQKTTPTISAISLVDGNDKLIFLTLKPLGTVLPASQLESVHETFQTGKPSLSKPFQSPINDRKVVALNVPVMREGKVIYCLRGIFRVDTLSSLIKPEKLPQGWISGMFDQDGITVARSLSPQLFVGKSAAPTLLKAIANKTLTAWHGVTKEGIETLSASRPVGDWRWTVAIGVPMNVLTATLHQELIRFGLITLGTVMCLALTVWILSRYIARRLTDVVEDARHAVTGGKVPRGSTGIRELDDLRLSLTHADIYRQAILDQVHQRTAELNAAKQQLTEFAQRLEDNIEQERLRIAREVHDQLGAIFTGVSMLISSLPTTAMTETQRRVLNDALNQGVATARRITAELRPPLLDDLGLQTAVENMAQSALTPANITCEVDLQDTDHLTPRQTIGCYRILQEAVTNVLRHSKSTHCQISGHITADNGYTLTVIDNGTGLKKEPGDKDHFGLTGMRERVRLMDGDLQLEGQTGQGLTVKVALPLVPEGGTA